MNTAHRIADGFRSVIGHWTPTNTTSQFVTKGTLTPAEFIEAGDHLVFKFPTWRWQSCSDRRRQVSWLPANKQYLITYGVACRSRVKDLEDKFIHKAALAFFDDEAWVVPANGEEESTAVEAVEPPAGDDRLSSDPPSSNELDEFDDVIVLEEDAAGTTSKGGAVERNLRSYDLILTYDKYYQTPRMWLRGYDGLGIPLSTNDVLEDILSDYVSKTVTIDPNPCTGDLTVSIHPCQHASMMKKVVQGWIQQGYPPRHDLSLIVFLKFIASVIPTIQYDLTVDIPGFSL